MANNQVAPMEPLAPTVKSWTFEMKLNGFASGMDSSTPPQLISTLQLPQNHQIQVQLRCENEPLGIFNGYSYISLYQYQLVLDKSVDYPLKISARFDPENAYGTLKRDLVSGGLVDIQPGVQLPIVALIYQATYGQQRLSQVDLKLLLTIHFTMPSTDDAELFPTDKAVHMRSHVEQLGSLLSLGQFADCKVVTNDDHFYDAHKNLLCLKSEVFQRAFETDMAEGKSNQIRMDCDSDMADLILPFFYTGQMPKVTKESAAELYRLAHLYHIEGLRAFLAEEILLKANQLVDVSNVLQFAVFADQFDLKVFRQFCIKFIQENRREVVKLPQWKEFRSSNLDLIDEIMSV